MEIILKQDVDNLGNKHDIVTVKPGYARNFLIPQGIAVARLPPRRSSPRSYVSSPTKPPRRWSKPRNWLPPSEVSR